MGRYHSIQEWATLGPILQPRHCGQPRIADDFAESPYEDLLSNESADIWNQDTQFALTKTTQETLSTEHVSTEWERFLALCDSSKTFARQLAPGILSRNIEGLTRIWREIRLRRQDRTSFQDPTEQPLEHRNMEISRGVGKEGSRKDSQYPNLSSKIYKSIKTRISVMNESDKTDDEDNSIHREQPGLERISRGIRDSEELDSAYESDSHCTSTTESQRSDGRERRPLLKMPLRKRELVDRIMLDFYAMFDPSSRIIACAGSSSSTPQQSDGYDKFVRGPSSRGGEYKRKATDEDSSDRDDDADRDSNKRRRPDPSNPGVNLEATKKFACPYFKHNPRRYQSVRSCPGPGWDTVHRLK